MNDDQLLRYNRHIMLPQIDIAGQQKLHDSHIIIIGMGGLGSPAALYLAASGIGKLTLVDFDVVEISNLQRQIVHTEAQLSQLKTESAMHTLKQINSEIVIETISEKLQAVELTRLCQQATLVLDATDNFASRQLINRACVETGTPLVSGAAIRFEGQVSVYDRRDAENACYACLYGDSTEEDDQTCSNNGILSPVVGTVGCIMATEAIKLICSIGKSLTDRLLLFDALAMQWREIKLNRDPACPVCGPAQEHSHD